MPSRTHIPALFSSSSCVISLARLLEQGKSDDCRKKIFGYQRTRKMDAKHGKIFRVALHRSLPKLKDATKPAWPQCFSHCSSNAAQTFFERETASGSLHCSHRSRQSNLTSIFFLTSIFNHSIHSSIAVFYLGPHIHEKWKGRIETWQPRKRQKRKPRRNNWLSHQTQGDA